MDRGVALLRDGKVVECNPRLAEILGKSVNEIIDRPLTGLHALDGSELVAAESQLAEWVERSGCAGCHAAQWQVTRPDGSIRRVDAVIVERVPCGDRGFVIALRESGVGRIVDCSDPQRRDMLELPRQFLELVHLHCRATFFEFHYCSGELFWFEKEDADDPLTISEHGKSQVREVVVRHCAEVVDRLERKASILNERLSISSEVEFEDGSIRAIAVETARLVSDKKEMLDAVYGVVMDVHDLKTMHEFADRAVHVDRLTNLPNRKSFLEILHQEFSAARRKSAYSAVLCINMHDFSRIQIGVGYRFLDQLVLSVSRCLRSLVRASDAVAYLGNGEFAILAREVSSSAVAANRKSQQIANRLRAGLCGDYQISGQSLRLRFHVGTAIFPCDGIEPLSLLHRASTASRVGSANAIAVTAYRPEIVSDVEAEIAVENELWEALRAEQFELYYQPKIRGGVQVYGAEALLRWRHPERGLLLPGQFMEIAEKSGLIVEIGAWVIETACRKLHEWNKDRSVEEALSLAVNVSPRQVRDPNLPVILQRFIARYGVSPAWLTIEITESDVLGIDAQVWEELVRLKKLGVMLSIDDFGMGHSSLRYLNRLPVDEIKIDKEFVTGLSDNSRNNAIVRSIVAIGEAFQLDVVAEGVESEADGQSLSDLGCVLHQGYYYARPMPAVQFQQLYCSDNEA